MSDERQDHEANEFAMELLMPEAMVRERATTETALCGVKARREVAHNWIGRDVPADDFCPTCRVLLDGEIEAGRATIRATVEWVKK